jgi:hypothetical protein
MSKVCCQKLRITNTSRILERSIFETASSNPNRVFPYYRHTNRLDISGIESNQIDSTSLRWQSFLLNSYLMWQVNTGTASRRKRSVWDLSFSQSNVFWDVVPCSLLKVSRRFEGTYRLHLRGWRIRCPLHADFSRGYSSALKMELTCSSETSDELNGLHCGIFQRTGGGLSTVVQLIHIRLEWAGVSHVFHNPV